MTDAVEKRELGVAGMLKAMGHDVPNWRRQLLDEAVPGMALFRGDADRALLQRINTVRRLIEKGGGAAAVVGPSAMAAYGFARHTALLLQDTAGRLGLRGRWTIRAYALGNETFAVFVVCGK